MIVIVKAVADLWLSTRSCPACQHCLLGNAETQVLAIQELEIKNSVRP